MVKTYESVWEAIYEGDPEKIAEMELWSNKLMRIEELGERAVKKRGIIKQFNQTIEECAELIVAIQKHLNRGASIEDVITEVADVEIMITQMRYMLGPVIIDNEIDRKLDKLEKVLDNNIP